MGDWIEKPLGEILRLTKGISYKSSDYGTENDGIIFINLKCIAKSGGFSPRGIKYYKGVVPENLKLKHGDILIANTDLTRNGNIVGCPLILPNLHSDEITMSMDLSRLDFVSDDVDEKFVYFALMNFSARNFMKENSSGSTVLHLKTSKVPFYKILIPISKEEQSAIATILTTIDQAISKTEQLIAKYERIKTGLMQDLLTRGIDEEGNIRSEKTHEFKDSVLGRIPKEWEVEKLDSLADVSSGVTLGKKHEGENTVLLPYLRVANVQDGYLDLKNIAQIRIPKGNVPKYLLQFGDVLMNEGGDFDKLGRGAVWEEQINNCLHQNHVFKVRCNLKLLNPYFLALYSESPFGKKFFVLNSKQSTNLASINSTQLKSFPIPRPRIEEQNRIIEIIKSESKGIHSYLNDLEKLRKLKSGLMQDLLTGKVRVDALIQEN